MVKPLSLGWRVLHPTAATLKGGIWGFGHHLGSGRALVGGSSCVDGVPWDQNHSLGKHPEIRGSNKRAK